MFTKEIFKYAENNEFIYILSIVRVKCKEFAYTIKLPVHDQEAKFWKWMSMSIDTIFICIYLWIIVLQYLHIEDWRISLVIDLSWNTKTTLQNTSKYSNRKSNQESFSHNFMTLLISIVTNDLDFL